MLMNCTRCTITGLTLATKLGPREAVAGLDTCLIQKVTNVGLVPFMVSDHADVVQWRKPKMQKNEKVSTEHDRGI
jgi:hypothetical protein